MKEVWEMSGFFRVLATLFVVLLLVGIGYGLYQVGVNVGVNVAVQTATQGGQPVTVVPYNYGHGGIGFFGILFWIIAFFVIIGLLRAAFGWGRGGRDGHWRHKSWGGPGYGSAPGGFERGGFGPDAFGWRGEQISEWHRELHRREEPGSAGPTTDGESTERRNP
jgi:hypothetical protein